MLGFLVGWWRARAARPLLWWVLALGTQSPGIYVEVLKNRPANSIGEYDREA
jgi:hypothetical protein